MLIHSDEDEPSHASISTNVIIFSINNVYTAKQISVTLRYCFSFRFNYKFKNIINFFLYFKIILMYYIKNNFFKNILF
jgi:hypothetical protein